ncbi:hypothetical protein [Sphingomonas sp. NIBR02145]|uniref:hypothetical protein n=1 Tax=Sphingomonas sp. NIBR02145 TaxID=3014784 RepID=UPI0022B3F565|nr:hypothetical protein [Sphingomonas sp. NIBR02145]WHU02719.1 hypothetical protein O3305_21490 [Sphingomonas sp. NIBR02145]
MHGLDSIRQEHRELLRLTEAVMEAAGAIEPSFDKIAAARHALGQAGSRHVIGKLSTITQALQASADPAHLALGRRFTDELMTLRQSASEHYGLWTMARVKEDPREFRMAVRSQYRALKARVDWEEAEVFPVVAQLLAAPAAMPVQHRATGIR